MGNSTLLVVMVVILAFFFFWTWRNNRKRQKAEAEKAAQLQPGVDVMTNFGLFGTIHSLDLENNKVVLELSPGTLVTVHKQAISRIETPASADDEDVAAPVSSAIDDANAAAQAQANQASDVHKNND
ncbi:MAG: preprotein translocase subunit YajC [Microbacteriaceae bacterium]|nr:preprotein translocase subunit YajC [Microbacteriaceae bacterium]MCL2795377.1 preprotein translocase subunit YajC [Microbacteriaceae bacterium]